MEADEQKNPNTGCITVFVIIITLLLVGGIIFFTIILPKLTSDKSISTSVNTDGAGKLFSRSANNNDIEFHVNDEFSFSINMLITPKTDIKDLQMTFTFIDENEQPLTTKNYILGNVTKGIPYTVSYKLSDFSFSQMLKIGAVKAKVTGGTVSYFA